jgi:prephenate dehydrogenase
LAFGWMALAARTPRLAESFELSGSGFRDFTRIAASSAALWADIVIDNRAAIAELLEQHVEGVTALREALLAGDRAHLLAVFGEASRLRRSLP